MALIIPGLNLNTIDELFGAATVDYKVNQINAMTLPVLDRKADGEKLGAVAAATTAGTWVELDGVPWLIVSQARTYRADGLLLTLSAQSGLGARLKADRGPRGDRGITPGQWITKRAKANGGTAVVQEGAKRRHIVQKRGQSALSVVEALSSDMGTSWVEVDGTLYVGTPWWAYEGGPKLPVWSINRGSAAVTEFEGRDSTADDANSATASMTVPNEVARQLRPWHRIDLSGAAKADNGMWLIESVTHDLHRAPGSVELIRPRRSTVTKGSSSTGSGSGDATYTGDIPADGWVPGADKVWRMCNKTPREIVALALKEAANGVNWGSGNCLNWVSHVCTGSPPYFGAAGGHGGLRARYVWDNMPAGTPHGTDRNAPAGALVVWRHNSTGHVAISVGGGYMVTTNTGPVQRMPIGAYMGWGGYAGWMAPNFWT